MVRSVLSSAGLALTLLVAWPAAATGATHRVAPDGSGDFATLQAAVDAAAPHDIVELAAGTFAGPGNRDVDLRGKSITIRSESGDPSGCIIDCQGSSGEPHRGFLIVSGEGPDCVLEGLTITGATPATWEVRSTAGTARPPSATSCSRGIDRSGVGAPLSVAPRP